MKFPIILYDINKNKYTKNVVTEKYCTYFYSYQLFSVKILSGNGILYGVASDGITTSNGQELHNNFGYTLYIPNDGEIVTVRLWNDSYETTYSFRLELDIISEHYNDLLFNFKLPSYTELLPALLNDNKSEIVKRLLLDFRSILKHRGTKESINKFFQFIGYSGTNLHIFDEYENLFNEKTISPNKLTDNKTGNYHMIYDNYTETGFDDNNLPIRELIIQDLDDFFQHLVYAINLANKYFTINEQDISFFGLGYSSNVANEPSITSNTSVVFEHDIFNFRKDINIKLWSHITSVKKVPYIDNCLYINKTIQRSEVKFFKNVPISKDIFYIDEEFFDDTVITEQDLTKIKRTFGIIFHLNIESPNTFIEYEIYDKNLIFNKIILSKVWLNNDDTKMFVINNISTYVLNIKITDVYNNVETFSYELNLNENLNRIDFEIFNSLIVNDMNQINNINLDIDSPTLLNSPASENSKNFILPINLIPLDLADYYKVSDFNNLKWLSHTNQYIPELINTNLVLDDITETIPLDLFDSWLNIISFKYDSDYDLMIRVLDIKNKSYKKVLIPYTELHDYSTLFDNLYITLMDINEKYVFDDWYLPARNELQLMYLNLHKGIDSEGVAYEIVGNFTNNVFWSSSEVNATNAWRVHFADGSLSAKPKSNIYRIRASRNFTLTETNPSYRLRDIGPANGYIFNIVRDDDTNTFTYYECSPANLTSRSFSNVNELISGTSVLISASSNNTNLIVNQTGHLNSAAQSCLDLIRTPEITPYYFITTNETGIDISQNNYDFVLVEKNNTENIISIYDLTAGYNFVKKKISVNYDFPLFPISSALYPLIETYISNSENIIEIEGVNFVGIKSLYPRLINTLNVINLKLGDICLCRLNDKYVVKEKNITWKVYNSFTKELILTVNDYMLKFRIMENTIYDVHVEFQIKNQNYQIFKKSLFSSFNNLINI